MNEALRRARPVIVDVIGASGVGKSTLIEAVLAAPGPGRHRAARVRWLSMAQARRRARQNALRLLPRLPVRARARVFARLVFESAREALWHGGLDARRLCRGPVDAEETRLLRAFLEAEGDWVLDMLRLRLDAARWPPAVRVSWHIRALSWIRQWVFTSAWVGDVGILTDESFFTRRAGAALPSEYGSEGVVYAARVRRLVQSRVGPRGVVHVDGSPDLILARNARRRGSTGTQRTWHRILPEPQHQEFAARQVAAYQDGAETFRAEGVPVLTVSAEAPLQENVRLVRHFLDEVASRAFPSSDQSPLSENPDARRMKECEAAALE